MIQAQAHVIHTVDSSDLADHLNPQVEGLEFPAVYTTGRMISLMEQAAALAMKPALQEGQVSVGVHLQISHLAPTLVGEEVRAEAEYQGLDGKLHLFQVRVLDRAGEIGKGTHHRAIVPKSKILDAAQARKA